MKKTREVAGVKLLFSAGWFDASPTFGLARFTYSANKKKLLKQKNEKKKKCQGIGCGVGINGHGMNAFAFSQRCRATPSCLGFQSLSARFVGPNRGPSGMTLAGTNTHTHKPSFLFFFVSFFCPAFISRKLLHLFSVRPFSSQPPPPPPLKTTKGKKKKKKKPTVSLFFFFKQFAERENPSVTQQT